MVVHQPWYSLCSACNSSWRITSLLSQYNNFADKILSNSAIWLQLRLQSSGQLFNFCNQPINLNLKCISITVNFMQCFLQHIHFTSLIWCESLPETPGSGGSSSENISPASSSSITPLASKYTSMLWSSQPNSVSFRVSNFATDSQT